MDSVLIVAAEASSSLYAQRLLEQWKREGRDIEAFGVGSRDMEKLGFECLGRSEEMAVVGLQEVIKHFPLIRTVYKSLLSEAEKRKPKFALLLDYPDFNLRLAKDLKKRGVKIIYYISPQVWAWRTGRVKTIRKIVDHMLVLFPFEEAFYKDHGVKVDFVGHPLLDELPNSPPESQRSLQRHRFGIDDDDIVVGLMPGSRNSEIEHHLQTQIETARILVRKNPKIRPVLLVAPTLEREKLKTAMGDADVSIQIIKAEPLEMISLTDVVLVASGTATLMVGLMEKPMVIMYRMNSITAWIAKKLVTKTQFFGLANLVAGKRVVPELFQEEANPERLAKEILDLCENESRTRVISDLKGIKERLGSRGATGRVAGVLASYLKERSP
ncbi:MAG TPA: lipid-A-disaccharide synthase [Bdellovibrionales bacterium]|nr:lipid-A-disaccharide synthase [Bdellovibrionales bacterium]